MLNVNVAIKPGWAGGKWHTQLFESALATAGYTVTDVLHADVVIAHSTACYDLKTKSPAPFYFIIDPPYWPGRSILSRLVQKNKHDNAWLKQTFGRNYILKKKVWEGVYILAKPRYTALALQNSSLGFLADLKDKQVTIIRNELDDFCSPAIEVALASYPNVRLIKLPGLHDDYYTHPQPYIALLPKTI